MAEKDDNSELGRRQFLRSVFGLGSLTETAQAEVQAEPVKATRGGKFYWADLRTGQVGFPSGNGVPAGKPGSIMKLVAAAALTNSKLMSPEEKIECRGIYKAHNEIFQCAHAHGHVDMVQALGVSCNVYFAHAADHISARTFLDYAQRFGLSLPVADFVSGQFPHIDLEGMRSDNYVLGLANDLQPSALQILRLSALIAMRGRIPYMHSAERPNGSAQEFETHLTETTWHLLEQGMRLAGREGTGKKLDPENKLKLALKTGTTPHGSTFQSWITGFFPWDSPRYAFVLRAPVGTSQEEAVPQARHYLFATDWP